MYRVVGCRECGALWIVADRPETTTCPRCTTRHRFEALHAFAETDDEMAARRARGALLADRAGRAEMFDALDATRLEASGDPDPEAPAESGLNIEPLSEAAEPAGAGPSHRPSRREVVLDAVATLERPTESDIIDYATGLDVPAEDVPGLIERLVSAGELTESGEHYRRL